MVSGDFLYHLMFHRDICSRNSPVATGKFTSNINLLHTTQFDTQYHRECCPFPKIFSNFVTLSNQHINIESVFGHPSKKMWQFSKHKD